MPSSSPGATVPPVKSQTDIQTEKDASGKVVSTVTTTYDTWEDGSSATTVEKANSDGTCEKKVVTTGADGSKTVMEQKTEANGDYQKTILKTPATGKPAVTTENKTGKTTTVMSFSMSASGNLTLKSTGTHSKKEKLVVPKTVTVDGETHKVTSIARKAFHKNTKMTSAKIGNNVRTIGAYAFSKNTSLKATTIGKNVKSIGAKTYYDDRKLVTVRINSTKLKSVGANAFDKLANKPTFYIKGSSKWFKKVKKMIQKSGVPKGAKFKRVK